jgi:membrane-associated protein
VHGPAIEKTLQLVEAHGYLLLFAASMAENLFLVGLVVPGDVIVVLGGALSAHANLTVGGVVASVVAGVVLGANASYWIGRQGGGMALVDRWGLRVSVLRVEDYFRLHGAKTVFLAAFVAGIKNLVPAVAGSSRMPVWRFVSYNAAGSIVRTAVLVCLGYFLGASLPRAVGAIGLFNSAALCVVAVLVTALLVARRITRARRQ